MSEKIVVGVILFFLIFLPKSISAAPEITASKGEFATSYDVLYDIDESGLTTVTEKITLKNLTSESYANKFKLTIGATQISDIKASDPGGPLEVTTEKKDASTTIGVKFNQQVAGLGKNLPWTITFKSKDFAEKAGKVWEIRTPRIAVSSSLASYNMTLSVPQSFGDLSSVSPTPKSQTSSGGKIYLTFDKNQLKESGISAYFGTNQLFDFDLSYHLENKNLMPILTSVALPPDTSFQDVIYQRIDPKPINVTLDNDGNYLAWYRLKRNERIDVKVIGSAKLYTNSKVKNPYLDESLRKKYIETQRYWEKDNPQITAKLKEILGENPPVETEAKAKLIFQFVVEFLKYDPSRLEGNIERLGAVTALNNPSQAVCMEFTDLFIALARAAGIPTRELDGYAYTSNPALRPLSLSKDILHSWPEYWDEKRGWVMIDPTWENTTGGVDYFSKLDLNHFVFVIKGSSSSDPVPAGAYKYVNEGTRDVKVSLSDNNFLGHSQIDISVETPSPILSGFPGKVKVKIKNSGNSFFPPTALQIKTNNLAVFSEGENPSTGIIPAFGEAEFSSKLRTKSLFDAYDDQITVLVGGQQFTKDIKVQPFILLQNVPVTLGGIIGIMVLLYLAVLTNHIYNRKVEKKKKANSP